MKLVVVIPYFYPAYVYGGAVFAAYNLSQKIAENGVDVRVITTNSNGDSKLKITPNEFVSLEDLSVKYYDKGFLPFFSFKMILGLAKDIKEADVVHIQSIYSLSTPLALFHSYLQNKSVLLSPRGSLTSWSFNHRGSMKKLWIRFLIKPFLKRINWHATSEREVKEIQFFFPNANVQLIPDGTSFEDSTVSSCNQKWKEGYYIACLGRIHKVKGYDLIIKAMPEILKSYPKLKLYIAGSDEGELENLMNLTKDLNLNSNIDFVGSLESDDKNCFLKHAQCLVMPSHTENFGIVAAEALFQTTPVIASKNTPWQSLEDEHAGFFIENSPSEISGAVISILKNVESFRCNTLKVVERFSWDKIAPIYASVLKKISY